MRFRPVLLLTCGLAATFAFAVESAENTSINQKAATNEQANHSANQDTDKRDTNKPSAQLEQRIQALEETLEEAAETIDDLKVKLSQQGNRAAPNTFNPAIGVILNGRFLSQSSTDYEFTLPGFNLAEESGPGESGLSLGESELNLTSNVDDKFYASITLAFGEETEVEEAFLKTTALPAGLQIKFGRFFSAIGYLNSHHTHSDDFADRPLAYQAFLGKNFGDDGVQLSWLAPTNLYWESGLEIYRGESFPAAGAANHGKGVKTLFSRIGGDINQAQNWRLGMSWLNADVVERTSEENGEIFNGTNDTWLIDFIWKWAPAGNSKITNAKIQGEFFSRKEKGEFILADGTPELLDSKQSGWYLQGVYQFMPQWRVGLRFDQLKSDKLPASFAGTPLDNLGLTPKQTSLMLDWSNSEYSRLRLQYSRDETTQENTNLWTLQYIAAFGAHSAHSF